MPWAQLITVRHAVRLVYPDILVRLLGMGMAFDGQGRAMPPKGCWPTYPASLSHRCQRRWRSISPMNSRAKRNQTLLRQENPPRVAPIITSAPLIPIQDQ